MEEEPMKMTKSQLVRIPLNQIDTDPVSDMLVESADLRPYLDHYTAVLTGGDADKTLSVIAKIPPEKRYISRVLQCLDWSLADYDSETLKLDIPYVLNDLSQIKERLHLRLWQLVNLIKTLEGQD